MTVRRMTRGADDGYHSELAPGLKSSADALRLAEEIAFAQARLDAIATTAPGPWAEIADPSGDLEERTWLAFLIALIGPAEDAEPYAEIERVRVPWSAGEGPDLADVTGGPRTSLTDGDRGRTLTAYRTWAARSQGQATAIAGDAAWTPQRRFARAYERLGLPGLHRGARFDLLVTLGAAGLFELEAGTLGLGGDDPVTVAAKRVLGIGDPILLERRAIALAEACEVPLQALDVGLFNWERGERAGLGVSDVRARSGLRRVRCLRARALTPAHRPAGRWVPIGPRGRLRPARSLPFRACVFTSRSSHDSLLHRTAERHPGDRRLGWPGGAPPDPRRGRPCMGG